MKPTAYLDQHLPRARWWTKPALHRGAAPTARIAGAGLDVFDQEPPPPNNPLFTLDNVILTPHFAGPTWDNQVTRFRNAFDNVQRVARGGSPALGHPGAERTDRVSETWHEIIHATLKAHEVRLVPYVPDNVLRPLLERIHADPFFTAFACTREEEAIGIASGAWMGGLKSIVLMQTSGFATLANVLASLPVPFRSPSCSWSANAARLESSTSASPWSPAPCARCWTASPWNTTR